MPYSLTAHVIVTSIVGVFHCTDVEITPTTERQWFRDTPVSLNDHSYAFAWAADTALERAEEDGITRDIWLIMDGVVADHYRARGI